MRILGQILALLLIAALLAFVSLREGGDLPQEVRGRLQPVDGDSFRLGGQEVRLVGIDAPEGRQECDRAGRAYPCGREAEAVLRRLAGGVEVVCRVEERDRHGRLLAVCEAGGVELNRRMVEEGWAVAYGRYEREEKAAASARRGLWSGRFERPRAWRDRNRGASSPRASEIYVATATSPA
jgi:endonuclease YncB( thermonuclease family)